MIKERAGTGEEETVVDAKAEQRTNQSDEVLEEQNVLDEEVEIDNPENDEINNKRYDEQIVVQQEALKALDSASDSQRKKDNSVNKPSADGTNYEDEEFDNDHQQMGAYMGNEGGANTSNDINVSVPDESNMQ